MDQRYYNAVYGRFMTADPRLPRGTAPVVAPSTLYTDNLENDRKSTNSSTEQARLSISMRWNRFIYASDDPVNRVDHHGTCDANETGIVGSDDDCSDDENGSVCPDGVLVCVDVNSTPLTDQPSCQALFFQYWGQNFVEPRSMTA